MTKQTKNDAREMRDRPMHSPLKIEARLDALDRWADRYGVNDVPAPRELVMSILLAASQSR